MGTMDNANRLYNLIALLITGYFPVQANGSTYLWILGNNERQLNGYVNI